MINASCISVSKTITRRIAVSLLICFSMSTSSVIAEDHSGTIYTETWTLANSPHHITGDADVANGDILTIEAGCSILFDGDYYLLVDGRLLADGDASNHITFSSNQGTPSPGDWRNIRFQYADAGCLLDYCDISYGGSAEGNLYFYTSAASVTISNCDISNSGTNGLFVTNSWPTISDTDFHDNVTNGIYCNDTSANPVVTDCSMENNGEYAVYTFGGNAQHYTGTITISGNGYDAFRLRSDNVAGVWLNHGVPYIIGGNQTCTNGQTLTIAAGSSLLFDGDYYLLVDGRLLADGDASNHITFSSNQGTPSPGDWRNIRFQYADAGCLLDYCDISYGGSTEGDIYFYTSSGDVTISNCDISNSGTNGLFVTNSWPTISDTDFHDNVTNGIYGNDTTANPVVTDCSMQNNGEYAVNTFGGNARHYTGTITISGNGYDAFRLRGDDVDGAWLNHGVPYIISGNQDCPNGATLTIAAGSSLLFDGDYYLLVDGTLVADGDASNHITFSSNQGSPSPGDWRGIRFQYTDAGCLLDYCDISYGGSAEGNLYFFNSYANVTISNSDISNSGTNGLFVTNSWPTISDTDFHDNVTNGIYGNDTTANPVVTDCSMQNNGEYAVNTFGGNARHYTGTITISGNGYDAFRLRGDDVDGAWLNHGVPYIISGNQDCPNGATLTIAAGSSLLFDGDYYLLVDGTLVADGDASNHITFSSNQGSPSPGDWRGIRFQYTDAGCLLDYCDISYGGSAEGNLYFFNSYANVTISNSDISNSGTNGLFVTNSWPTISDTDFHDNVTNGIYGNDTTANPVVTDCSMQNNGEYAVNTFGGNARHYTGTITISGNGYDAFRLRGDDVDGAWLNHGVPYIISGNQDCPNGATLTIAAGSSLLFDGDYYLLVDGTLVADGDASNHITFSSNQGSPSPGDWRGIRFQYTDAGCLLDYCDISYGGSAEGNLYFFNSYANVTISNSDISNSGTNGLFVTNSWPTISDTDFHDNVANGIYCNDTSANPVVTDCSMQNNGEYAVNTFGGNAQHYTGIINISGNGYDAFRLAGDDVAGTWLNHGAPYIISGNQNCPNGQTWTIVAGNSLLFDGDYYLLVDGTLIADGDASNHITFSSNQVIPSPGDWRNIRFQHADAGCLLDYCDVSYGGSTEGNIYFYNSSANVAISNSAISNSGNNGLYLDNSWPFIDACMMEDNATAGLYYASASGSPIINGCTLQNNFYGFRGTGGSPHFTHNNRIINNISYGFYLTDDCVTTFGDTLTEWNDIYGNGTYDFYNGNRDIYAYYVYWGTTDAGVIAGRIHDLYDDASLGIVYFAHWLDEDHENEFGLTVPTIVNVYDQADSVFFDWTTVPEALAYRVYSSIRPFAGFSEDVSGTFDGTSWSCERVDDLRFYYVTAVAGAEESGPSNTVGYEEYVGDIP